METIMTTTMTMTTVILDRDNASPSSFLAWCIFISINTMRTRTRSFSNERIGPILKSREEKTLRKLKFPSSDRWSMAIQKCVANRKILHVSSLPTRGPFTVICTIGVTKRLFLFFSIFFFFCIFPSFYEKISGIYLRMSMMIKTCSFASTSILCRRVLFFFYL